MFGKLVDVVDKKSPVAWDHLDADPDLKEHMVGILFSRSKLTYLQKQVRETLNLYCFSESAEFTGFLITDVKATKFV